MYQGVLGSVVQYDELTFRGSLKEGFIWGTIEAVAGQGTPASAKDEAMQKINRTTERRIQRSQFETLCPHMPFRIGLEAR